MAPSCFLAVAAGVGAGTRGLQLTLSQEDTDMSPSHNFIVLCYSANNLPDTQVYGICLQICLNLHPNILYDQVTVY